LTPAKNDFVVWIIPRDSQPQNAGVLKVNNDLKGSFRGTTPAKVFDLKITAEDTPSIAQPTGPEIFHGSIQAP
jgi:anti-sigma-K factor RskA